MMNPTTDITSDTQGHNATSAAVETASAGPLEPALKKWKSLTAKQRASAPPRTVLSGAQFELTKYLIEVRNSAVVVEDAFEFWRLRRPIYLKLAPLAEDLLAAPASQAYVEQIFSVCGLLTAG
jgi:hAT family C-terminal dimerisation region